MEWNLNGTIQIVMRKIDNSGQVSETILAALPDTNLPVGTHFSDTLTFPDLEIHVHEQLVYQDRILIPMSHHEFFTLLYLAQHPNWVFSKEQIYKAVWKEAGDGGAAVTNVISQIRRKIGDGYIKTVIGSGYKFEV